MLIDREQFEAARGTLHARWTRCRIARTSIILVFSPDYLTSKPCQHEMKRAIQRDPEFKEGTAIPREEGGMRPSRPHPSGPIRCVCGPSGRSDAQIPGLCFLKKCEADLGTPGPRGSRLRDDLGPLLDSR